MLKSVLFLSPGYSHALSCFLLGAAGVHQGQTFLSHWGFMRDTGSKGNSDSWKQSSEVIHTQNNYMVPKTQPWCGEEVFMLVP